MTITAVTDLAKTLDDVAYRIGARLLIRVPPRPAGLPRVLDPFSDPLVTITYLTDPKLRVWFATLDRATALAVTAAAAVWHAAATAERLPVTVEAAVASCALAAGPAAFNPSN